MFPVAAHPIEGDDENTHDDDAGGAVARRYLPLEQAVHRDRPDRDADREDREEEAGDALVGVEDILHERRKLDEQHRADRPEKADREDREIEARDVHRAADECDRRADDVPVDARFLMLGRGGGHFASGPVTDPRDKDDAERRPFDVDHAREDRARENRDIGARLDEPGAGQHLVALQVLRQDRIFDRAEKGRVDAHREEREHHERDRDQMHRKAHPREDEPEPADEHDQNFAEFDDADDPRLVARVGELARERGKQEEGQDEEPRRDRTEQCFRGFVVEHAVNDEEHHRVLEQIVVERAEELGDEKGQEPALLQ